MAALETNATIGVIGAGTMGAGIAQVAAAAGHPVFLYDAAAGTAKAGIERTRQGLQRLIDRGKMSEAEVEALVARITPADALEDLAPASLVIEAIIEDLAVKQSVFKELEHHCRPSTILASNTSSLSITAIGQALQQPERLVGMHFFNPAPILKLVEVVSGLATDDEVAQIAFDTAATWGKHPVHARSTPGFIVNRVARPFYAEALRVLEEGGADVATIDGVLKACGGFRMGPFELMDLIGNDVNFAVTSSVYDAYFQDPRFKPSLTQKELVDAGHLGRKTDRGFYDYSDDADLVEPATLPASPSPNEVVVRGDLGIAEPLVSALTHAGVNVKRLDGPGVLEFDGITLALSDGRTATRRAEDTDTPDLAVFDLALDYTNSGRMAIAIADQAQEETAQVAAGLFQALEQEVSLLDDIPGLIVMRTVCMLANEGADAVNQRVCTAEGCDTAMRSGVNYPQGPLHWAETIGLPRVIETLDNLAAAYGEDRYRVSPLLRRKADAHRGFHD